MRTASAYIYKIQREVLGKTYKVQDANHRLFTTTLYRGAVGCGPVDYTQLNYVEPCLCDYIGPAKKPQIVTPPPPKPCRDTIDGGTSSASGVPIIDGGIASTPGSHVIDGGNPGVCARTFDGGKPSKSGIYIVDGGRSQSSGTSLVDGGNTEAICSYVEQGISDCACVLTLDGGSESNPGECIQDGGTESASGVCIQDGGTKTSDPSIVCPIERLKIGDYEVKRCV